jgi:hypothetical protein
MERLMRQMIKKGRTENTQARRAGNLLMIAGVVTPIVGIAVTKFVEFEFETYRRVIQVIFITGLVLFIGGILVKNYWKGRKTDEGTIRPGCGPMPIAPFTKSSLIGRGLVVPCWRWGREASLSLLSCLPRSLNTPLS